MHTKKSLRQEMKARLSAQTAVERAVKSLEIKKKLFELPVFRRSKCVWFYVSLPEEVETLPMICEALGAGKKILVPLTDLENKKLSLFEIRDPEKELRPGVLGIREPDRDLAHPAKIEEADCVIVPGLAFDKAGHRLGRGAGLYDRSLAKLSPRVPKIGLAFSFQIFPEIPQEDHDQTLDVVLTD